MNMNMFIQVSGSGPVSQFVNTSKTSSSTTQSKAQEKERDTSSNSKSSATAAAAAAAAAAAVAAAQAQDSLDDMSLIPDDDDINTSYNCETCNRVMKGKVMLQAHRYQEHHENPEFEASSFPDDKYACRVCLKLFTRNSDVKAHILRVHCGDRRYPCTLCGKR